MKKRLTEEQKEYIQNGNSKGYNSTIIGDILGVSSAAVRKHLGRSRNIAGLPPKIKLSKKITRGTIGLLIKKIALNDSKLSIPGIRNQLIEELPEEYHTPSLTTIRKFLTDNGWKNVNSRWTVPINYATMQKRVAFARKWLRNGKSIIGNVIWSDETTVKSHPNGRRQKHWTPAKSPRPNQLKIHSGGISQMFWGCISEHGTGPLITIDGTMDSDQYIKVLDEQLIPELEVAKEIYQGEWKIMQDNAPCHRAKKVINFLSEKGAPLLEWPAYSPDLNPIENIWNWMKSRMGQCNSKEELETQFLEIWDSITPDMCKRYCSEYEKRLKAVIKSKGRKTKY